MKILKPRNKPNDVYEHEMRVKIGALYNQLGDYSNAEPMFQQVPIFLKSLKRALREP